MPVEKRRDGKCQLLVCTICKHIWLWSYYGNVPCPVCNSACGNYKDTNGSVWFTREEATRLKRNYRKMIHA